MFQSVLVVCVGNICRSPVGERLLIAKLQERGASLAVASAGLGALVGHGADETAAAVAAAQGVNLDGHIAQQFSRELAATYDLILTMEPGHRGEIIASAPDVSGKVMAFDHWQGGKGIADPYRRSREFHEEVMCRPFSVKMVNLKALECTEMGPSLMTASILLRPPSHCCANSPPGKGHGHRFGHSALRPLRQLTSFTAH